MKIKKYTGDTIQDAMDKLKEDLGPNAVVLNSRVIKSEGFFRFFKKPKFEITAAYEEKEIMEVEPVKTNYENSSIEDIKGDLSELKSIIEKLSWDKDKVELPEEIRIYHRIMVENGVDYNIAYAVLKDIEKNDIVGCDKIEIKEIVKNKIKNIMGESEVLTVGDDQEVVFFIGPTGVGKTTSLSKIAASLVLEEKYEVGLITSDTYRVGAVDQLKIYSEILNLPLEVVYNESDFNEAFSKMKDKDVILVDTAGRNHNNYEQTEDLKNILNTKRNKQIYLLLNATSDIRVLETLVQRYNFMEDYKIVITKIDESNNYGSILNIKYIFDKEIIYYTIGQNVPEDIRVLDADKLADRLIKER